MKKLAPWSVLFVFGIACLASLTSVGCGDSSTNPNPVATPTPAPTTTLLLQDSFAGIGALQYLAVPFNTTQRGFITADMDWTDPANTMVIIGIAPAPQCTETQVNNETCPYLTNTGGSDGKPQKRITVPTDPGAYFIYMGNVGPGTESFSYQVFLTTGS